MACSGKFCFLVFIFDVGFVLEDLMIFTIRISFCLIYFFPSVHRFILPCFILLCFIYFIASYSFLASIPSFSLVVFSCISVLLQRVSNKMQQYTVYFIWELLYIFRVILSPIIRRANNFIYRICYLSHRYCFMCRWCTPHPQHTQTSSRSSTTAAYSNNGVTNTRCCTYSCLRS